MQPGQRFSLLVRARAFRPGARREKPRLRMAVLEDALGGPSERATQKRGATEPFRKFGPQIVAKVRVCNSYRRALRMFTPVPARTEKMQPAQRQDHALAGTRGGLQRDALARR